MASTSEDDVSSEGSFGWVNVEDKKTGTKKISAVRAEVMSSDSEEDSDATEFEEGDDSDKTVGSQQELQLELEENVSSATNAPPHSVEDPSGALDASRNENSTGSLADNSQYEDENSDEESGEEDEKPLKPFTKELIVKIERFSHTLSDDGNNDSPPVRRSMRVKSESKVQVQKHAKLNKSGTLVEGALIDSSQTLPFDIGANEDVWIVQCPREISASTLMGKTLNFKGVSHIDQFESNVLPAPQIESVNLLLPKAPGKVINVVPNGHIVFKEKETKPEAIYPLHREENIISLPTGLKLRHPLFGTELSMTKAPFGVSPAKKKKKKKKNKHHDTSVENEYSATENGETGVENIADYSNQLSPSPVHMKAKNKKRHGECFNELDKEILLGDSEGINSISVKKIKKHKAEIADSNSMSSSLAETSLELYDDKIKKKKKKKHKYDKEFESEYVKPMINQLNEDGEYSTSLLTQRLHESEDDLLAVSSSDILKQKKKKKKKIKREDYNEISNFSSETADDSFVPPHKKSKKIKLHHSDRHLDQAASATIFTKTSKVEKMTADTSHRLDHEMEEMRTKKRKKLSLSQISADNSTETFNSTIVDQEPDYIDETHTKKKKKKKKKSE